MYKKGFTLVELSIVLVIIGLLIGGILVAQSLIDTAKTQKVINRLSEYNIAVQTFKERFNELPGDMLRAVEYWGVVAGNCQITVGTGTQTCNGNGNKHLELDWSSGETTRFWQHLYLMGILNDSYTGASDNGTLSGFTKYVPDLNAPSSPHDKNSVITVFYATATQAIYGSRARDLYAIGNPTNTISPANNGRWFGPSFTGAQALSLDVKLDDGVPTSGEVFNIPTTISAVAPNCYNGNGYRVAEEEPICSPLIDTKWY